MINFELFTTLSSTGAAAHRTRGVAVSATSTYYSNKISSGHVTARGVHFEWTGTPTGAITRWESDKAEPDETSDADWVQDSSFASSDPAGVAGKFRNESNGRSARWIRYKYVNASGSGSLFGRVTVGGN